MLQSLLALKLALRVLAAVTEKQYPDPQETLRSS